MLAASSDTITLSKQHLKGRSLNGRTNFNRIWARSRWWTCESIRAGSFLTSCETVKSPQWPHAACCYDMEDVMANFNSDFVGEPLLQPWYTVCVGRCARSARRGRYGACSGQPRRHRHTALLLRPGGRPALHCQMVQGKTRIFSLCTEGAASYPGIPSTRCQRRCEYKHVMRSPKLI